MIGYDLQELTKIIIDEKIKILELEMQKARLKYEGGNNGINKNT